MTSVGVALSGGGHRAALFGLGVLAYLVDAKKNAEVTSIASVSGGSLTNGVVAQAESFRTISPEAFSRVANDLRATLVAKGTLWRSPFTRLYLLGLAATLLSCIAVWFQPWGGWTRAFVFVVVLLFLGLYLQIRGLVCGMAFARALYSPKGRYTRLSEVASEPDHVFCATDLHAGEHVYFSGRFVCSYRFGYGEPGDVPLHTVVQASAAYPAGFPPRWLSTKRHRFREPQDPDAQGTRAMALVDGGVYDNMADQWGFGVARRNRRWANLSPGLPEPDELVVVNSSAPIEFGRVWKLRLPVVGEVLTFLRDVNVLYDNTTTPRRRLLYMAFEQAARSGRGPRGALVQISQSPFDVPTNFERGAADDPVAERAQRALAALGDTREEWAKTVTATSGVKTTLSRIHARDAAQLMRHGYVLAMVNLYVILGYQLLPIPAEDQFMEPP